MRSPAQRERGRTEPFALRGCVHSGVWFHGTLTKSVQRSHGQLVSFTPSALRAICDSLNDELGTDRRSKLARLLGWHHSTLWRKLAGKSRITESDALAIRKAVEMMAEGR
jgi:hypothetical protein